MKGYLEITVAGTADSGKTAIIQEIAKMLRSHGLNVNFKEEDVDSIQEKRLESLKARDPRIDLKEVHLYTALAGTGFLKKSSGEFVEFAQYKDTEG